MRPFVLSYDPSPAHRACRLRRLVQSILVEKVGERKRDLVAALWQFFELGHAGNRGVKFDHHGSLMSELPALKLGNCSVTSPENHDGRTR
jgi:hypothetical protein